MIEGHWLPTWGPWQKKGGSGRQTRSSRLDWAGSAVGMCPWGEAECRQVLQEAWQEIEIELVPQSWGAKQSYALVWRDLEGPVDRWEAVSAKVETGNVRSEGDWRETRMYKGSERGWMVRSGQGRS